MQRNQLASIPSLLTLTIAAAGCASTSHEAVGSLASPQPPVPVAVELPDAAVAADAAEAPEAPSAPASSESTPSTAPLPAAPSSADGTPLHKGAFRVGAGSGFLYQNTDFGGGDQTDIGLGVSVGTMLTDNLMVEGVLDYTRTELDANGGGSVDTSSFEIGAAVRYYFTVEGRTKPYVRAVGGLVFADVDAGGSSNDDSAPFLGIGGGAETFFTEFFALEYGLRLDQAFDLFDDDSTNFGLFVGLSIWF